MRNIFAVIIVILFCSMLKANAVSADEILNSEIESDNSVSNSSKTLQPKPDPLQSWRNRDLKRDLNRVYSDAVFAIIDINNDRMTHISFNDELSKLFDIDSDGISEKVAWYSIDEAILTINPKYLENGQAPYDINQEFLSKYDVNGDQNIEVGTEVPLDFFRVYHDRTFENVFNSSNESAFIDNAIKSVFYSDNPTIVNEASQMLGHGMIYWIDESWSHFFLHRIVYEEIKKSDQ
jgi:hypothetical protein